MKQIHIDRLLKLADHLEHGQLGHKVFDFTSFNVNGEFSPTRGTCGTNGCAIGECPVLFPEDWTFAQNDYPVLKEFLFQDGTSNFDNVDGSAEYYFGLTEGARDHLFYPDEQNPEFYCGERLGDDAVKEQVAANIRAFVALKLPTIEKD